MTGLSLGTCTSNLKSVSLTVLEQVAFNAQTFRGHVTLATSLFENFVKAHIRLSKIVEVELFTDCRPL